MQMKTLALNAQGKTEEFDFEEVGSEELIVHDLLEPENRLCLARNHDKLMLPLHVIAKYEGIAIGDRLVRKLFKVTGPKVG